MCCIPTLSPYDSDSDPVHLDSIISQCIVKNDREPVGMRAEFDHDAIQAYYDDAFMFGEDAFVRSHSGSLRAGMLQNEYQLQEVIGKEMKRGLEASGPMMNEELTQSRAEELRELAERLQECRRMTRDRQ